MTAFADGVYALPVAGRWLVYAPLHGRSALLSGAAMTQLRGEPRGLLAKLAEELAAPGEPQPQPRSGPLRPLFLGLVPTRACNLRCVYCAFGGGNAPGPAMPPELAVRAIDWMAGHVQALGLDRLDVHFFGGEPVLAEDLLDVAVHRVRFAAALRGLRPHLEISTNGVCSEQRARWLGDYFDAVVLSFDGWRETHDRCRPHANGRGSFDEVTRTARILGRTTVELCLRICVTAANVASLPAVVRAWCSDFRIDAIDFETLQPNRVSNDAGLESPDPYEFAAAYWEARRIAGEHGVTAVYSAWPAGGELRRSFCPVGKDAVIVMPDGRVSACYLDEAEWRRKGMDLVVGRFGAGDGLALDLPAVDRARRLGPDHAACAACFCRWTCAGGCHVNHRLPPSSTERDGFCAQTRLISAAGLLEMMGHAALAKAVIDDRPAAFSLVEAAEALA